MRARSVLAVFLVSLVAIVGCDRDAMMSSKGFRLPDGDAEAGREAFLYMQCHQCHTIQGEELPQIPGMEPPYVELGGKVTRVMTYGELITSIINPSHKLAKGYAEEVVSEDGRSNMYIYNQHMTVQELVDIVMFLQPHYDVVVPDYRYTVYP